MPQLGYPRVLIVVVVVGWGGGAMLMLLLLEDGAYMAGNFVEACDLLEVMVPVVAAAAVVLFSPQP